MDAWDTAARQLRRHARRRAEGIPTVSVLVGDATDWMERVVRLLAPCATLRVDLPATAFADTLAKAGLEHVARICDLEKLALDVIAGLGGAKYESAHAAWRARAAPERELWLEGLALGSSPGAAGAARWLQQELCHKEWARAPGDAVHALRDLLVWLPPERRPALCVSCRHGVQLQAAVELALQVPALALVVVVATDAPTRLFPALSGRSAALLHEGLIHVPGAAAGAPTPAPALVGETATEVEAREDVPVALHQLHELAARSLHEARTALASGEPAVEEALERARSLAERLLFELLQRQPATRDLFELNGRMPFSFGSRAAEIDLVASPLKLAIEVDGYHHFTELDAYRRDRRKDVLLQRHDFLVSRYLASDVVERPEDVVLSITELVLLRKGLPVSGQGG